MQYNFSCTPRTSWAIQTSLSPSRLKKYLAEAKGSLPLAIRLYIWNSRICSTFYGPIQIVEVVVRNAISKPIKRRFGPNWPTNAKFANILNQHQRRELQSAIAKEAKQHGANMTSEHVLSAMHFGFWTGLMASRMDKQLWAAGISSSFPHAPAHATRQSIHNKLNSIREFRNDVMHYRSVFDKKPKQKMKQLDELLGYLCLDTRFMVAHAHELEVAISNRPT